MHHGRAVRAIATVVTVCVLHVAAVPSGWAQSAGGGANEQTESTGAQYGFGTASVFLSLPYGLGKFLFATLGGIFGGFTYAFSGGNEKAAKSVWDTSMRGTYVITPEHLKGEKTVRFFGVPAETADAATEEPAAEPIAPAPVK